jgi:DNA-directed RNA polymerase subunit beta
MTITGHLKKKFFKRYKKQVMPLPNLIQHQIDAYNNFLDNTVKKIFNEFDLISDYSEKKFDLVFKKYRVEKTKLDDLQARKLKTTLESTIKATYELVNKTTGTKKEQEIFMFKVPVMTPHGSFVVNGVERIIQPQLVRSFGIFFTANDIKKERRSGAKIIPARGS